MITEKYIAAIDLGTAKFALSVAKVKGDDVQVIYYREVPAVGMRNSNIAIPKKASDPLEKLIREAENERMIKIMQVVIGLPRYSVTQEIANGGIPRGNPDDYITREEVEALKSIAVESYPLDDPDTQIMFGAVAQSFSIDDQIQLVEEDVIGTLSSTLEGSFKVFVGSRRATTAIDKIFNSLGIAIAKKYFLPDVVAETVLSEEEKDNGVALIDFGAGVTSVAIYHGGIMRHYAAIPFGGRSITSDIRSECSISEKLAENIKLAYGACLPSRLSSLSEKIIQIRYEDAPYKEVPVKYLSEIIDARAREIIDAILFGIQESGLEKALRSGIVLTGGGANLANLKNLIKDMSGYNVRVGYPKHLFSASGCLGVYDPSATSAIGMLLAAKRDNLPDCAMAPEAPKVEVPAEEPAWEEAVPIAQMTEEEFIHGTSGKLIEDEAFGEPVKPQKKPKAPKTPSVFWKKINVKLSGLKGGLDKLYTDITDDNI